MGNGLTYYSEEAVYRKVVGDEAHNYSYWKQMCEGFIISLITK